MTYLGELVLIKEEDIKEEEPEENHESSVFDEVEGVYRQGEKRCLSPSFDTLQMSNKQLPSLKTNEMNQQTMIHLHSGKCLVILEVLTYRKFVREYVLDLLI